MAVHGDGFQQEGFYAKYNILEILGNGNFCIVRKCICKKTNKEYAVKIIEQSSDDVIMQMIKAGIEVLRRLPRHSYILYVQDVFWSPVHVFIVLELAGCELFDYLSKHVKLSEKKTRLLTLQLFLAVEHLHRHNIVHRDLKAENILLDKGETLKLSNFWYATSVNDGELLTDVAGTPSHWAPEMIPESSESQKVSGGYGKEVDLWACGVLIYTLLAGFPPFWHRKRWLMLKNIKHCQYEFVSPGWDDISDEPKNLICNLLIQKPWDRYTAHDALQHSWLQSVQITPDLKRKVKRRHSRYDPTQKFRVVVHCITVCRFLLTLKKPPISVNMSMLSNNPYEYKYIRKSLDGCAFNMYGHWVKHGEQQNRAALFEAIPKHHLNGDLFNGQMIDKQPFTPRRAQKMHRALKRTLSIVD